MELPVCDDCYTRERAARLLLLIWMAALMWITVHASWSWGLGVGAVVSVVLISKLTYAVGTQFPEVLDGTAEEIELGFENPKLAADVMAASFQGPHRNILGTVSRKSTWPARLTAWVGRPRKRRWYHRRLW